MALICFDAAAAADAATPRHITIEQEQWQPRGERIRTEYVADVVTEQYIGERDGTALRLRY